MSQNYAAGLSKYANKGVLGLPEIYDSEDILRGKVLELVELIRKSKHIVLHTGAGISTAAGISDFRGPKGIWTAEKKKIQAASSLPFHEAIPTYTHMAIRQLVANGFVKFVVSQNIDGLHVRSGLSIDNLAELHGNVFMEECKKCHALVQRNSVAPTIGRRATGGVCAATRKRGTPCRGALVDTVLDWCSALPEVDLSASVAHSRTADLNVVLGSTMQIMPSGELPTSGKIRDQSSKFVICNLQKTKLDDEADLIIRAKVDDIFRLLMEELGVHVDPYQADKDPVLFGNQERSLLTRNLIQPPQDSPIPSKKKKRKVQEDPRTEDEGFHPMKFYKSELSLKTERELPLLSEPETKPVADFKNVEK